MDNITIGIIARNEKINDTEVKVVTKNNLKYLNNMCNYIGIFSYDDYNFNYDVLKLCDGIIIQGGTEIYPYHYKIIDYAINNNIPVLGICMGHQIMGLYSTKSQEEALVKVDNHYRLGDQHLIHIDKDSKLYKIFNDKIYVNTRHLFKVDNIKAPFKIAARSDDNVIEAMEYIDDNHFLIGVQWHPEDMDNMQGLYNYFLKEVIRRKQSK